ncbi:MAG: DUF4350 domain-containing protein [Phenylobacterium sp.]
MSRAEPALFSPRVVLAMVLVGVFAFCGFAVLSAYAPDLRGGDDGRGHALSRSAVGYAGAVALLKAAGVPVVVSRAEFGPQAQGGPGLVVLTPEAGVDWKDVKRLSTERTVLIVLPKWTTTPDPRHKGWTLKTGSNAGQDAALGLLNAFSYKTTLARRAGWSTPRLAGAGAAFAEGANLPLDRIDSFQTLAGEGWEPALVDETGRMVLARAKGREVFVLAEPDLLNTQGLRGLDNARAGLAAIDVLRRYDQGVAFDVTLNGFERGRSLLRLIFQPPLLGATLAALAAALLMGWHAAVRFGPSLRPARAFALGELSLVENAAGLVRMARKEARMAPAYAALMEARVAASAGGDRAVAGMARLGGTSDDRQTLVEAAGRVTDRSELLGLARRLHRWRMEMTRERG